MARDWEHRRERRAGGRAGHPDPATGTLETSRARGPTDIPSFRSSSCPQRAAGRMAPTRRAPERRHPAAAHSSPAPEMRERLEAAVGGWVRTEQQRGGPTAIGAQPSAASQWVARAPRGRGGSGVLGSVTRRRRAAVLWTTRVPGGVRRPSQVSALAEGPRLEPGRGCPGRRPEGRPTRAAAVPGRGSGGGGNGLRGRAGPRPGGRLRLCGRFTWRAAGTAGQRQRTGAQPRRAGTRRIPAGSGGRAKEAGGLETLRMWHLRLPGQAEPGGHLALGPPGPQPPSALAARLRVWEKVLGAGAWGGGSGHRGHLGDPGFPRSTRRLYSGCGGAAQLTGGFRNGVEGPDGERPLKRVRILLGSVWALPPTCLSLPRPQHLFSLQSVQIKNYRSRALSIVTCRLIGWCQGIGANRVFSTKTSSLGVFASISKFWLKSVGHSFSGTCGLHLL